MVCSFSRKTHTLRRTCWRGLLTKNSRKVGDKRRWRRVGRGEGWRVGRREHTCWSWWETWGNSNSFRVQYLLFCDLCLNTCVKNWAIVMKTTDHAKGVLKNLPPLLHYRFMTLCATLWILLLFWFLRVWGIDCSCKRLYLAMQATHVCCWAFRQKGLTLELRGYLHGREGQQRAKEIRATQHLQGLWIMLAWANEPWASMMVTHQLLIVLLAHAYITW